MMRLQRFGGEFLLGLHERGREVVERAVDVAVEVVANQLVGRERGDRDGDGDGGRGGESDATLEAHGDLRM